MNKNMAITKQKLNKTKNYNLKTLLNKTLKKTPHEHLNKNIIKSNQNMTQIIMNKI